MNFKSIQLHHLANNELPVCSYSQDVVLVTPQVTPVCTQVL